MSEQIVKNSVVSLNYELLDTDGNVLEKTDAPIAYLHGGYDGIFPRVEEALHGKQTGDTCSVRLEPDDAFGDYDEDLIRVEPRNLFPKNVSVGMQFEGAAQGSDQAMLYTVTDVADDKVVVDANHPLAGKALQFNCTVTEVRQATAEELQHGHVHGAGGHHH
ncbi:MAG: peptidylprolyl isomerase [Burkholderiales bacterium]|nr:peptidylprolyl isomerase [Burkholderiales bacterium]